MIVSANPVPELNEFDSLLEKTISVLNSKTGSSSEKIELMSGTKLENYAADIMKEISSGTPFADSIECTPGQSFPDIVAKKLYGVEVKTTIKNHWKTTGNSVMESSRIDGIERIFMLFGKLADPVEFRYRPYEDCLSEVVVTHSPRYLIDMNLSSDKTIFKKMGTSYDELRNQPNPIKNIVNYYKKGLKKGDDLWWIDSPEPQSSNLIIKIWNNLSLHEKKSIVYKGFAFFPELLSSSNDKFGRLSIWLVTTQGVVCPNVRDIFTGGGKMDITTNYGLHKRAPKVLYNLSSNIDGVLKILMDTPATELSEYWNIETTEKAKIKDWVNLVSNAAIKLKDIEGNEVLAIINEMVR